MKREPLSEKLLAAAWEMRKAHVCTMREIANQLKVGREQLIDELTAWLGKKEKP